MNAANAHATPLEPHPSPHPGPDLDPDPASPDDEPARLAIARLLARAGGCQRRDDAEGAVAHYTQVLAHDPKHALAMLRLANLRMQLQQPTEALAIVDRALALLPQESALHYTRALVLHQLQRLNEAQGAYDNALLLGDPPERVHFAQAGTCLMQGDFARGWALYEDRPTLGATLAPWLALGLERLPAGASADGRGVLLVAEQGYGDMLQFARFATDLAARCGAPVWLVGPPALRGLLSRLAAQARLAGVLEGAHTSPTGLPEGLGWVLPLGSLPLHLGLQQGWAQSPGHPDHQLQAGGYLQADPARVAHWRGRLGLRTRPLVALAWCGHQGRQADWGRSIPLAQLLPWLPEGIDYVHVQPDVRESDREALVAAPQLRHFGAAIRDFDDSAALCMEADLVVSVCTSTAHLAGGLGRPTLVLLRRTPCWRWGPEGDTCAWYPSARLLRQPDHRQWEPVLASLNQALLALRDGHSTEAIATTISPTAAQSCQ